MTDFGQIADKFAKRRARFARVRAPEDAIDVLCRILSEYPWVAFLCCVSVITVIGLAAIFIYWVFHP